VSPYGGGHPIPDPVQCGSHSCASRHDPPSHRAKAEQTQTELPGNAQPLGLVWQAVVGTATALMHDQDCSPPIWVQNTVHSASSAQSESQGSHRPVQHR
jgi:hypothetical protein